MQCIIIIQPIVKTLLRVYVYACLLLTFRDWRQVTVVTTRLFYFLCGMPSTGHVVVLLHTRNTHTYIIILAYILADVHHLRMLFIATYNYSLSTTPIIITDKRKITRQGFFHQTTKNQVIFFFVISTFKTVTWLTGPGPDMGLMQFASGKFRYRFFDLLRRISKSIKSAATSADTRWLDYTLSGRHDTLIALGAFFPVSLTKKKQSWYRNGSTGIYKGNDNALVEI